MIGPQQESLSLEVILYSEFICCTPDLELLSVLMERWEVRDSWPYEVDSFPVFKNTSHRVCIEKRPLIAKFAIFVSILCF